MKKLICILLSFLMIFTMAGCAQNICVYQDQTKTNECTSIIPVEGYVTLDLVLDAYVNWEGNLDFEYAPGKDFSYVTPSSVLDMSEAEIKMVGSGHNHERSCSLVEYNLELGATDTASKISIAFSYSGLLPDAHYTIDMSGEIKIKDDGGDEIATVYLERAFYNILGGVYTTEPIKYPEVWEPYYETLALKIQAQAEIEAQKLLEDAKVIVEEPAVSDKIELIASSEEMIAPNDKNSVKVTWVDKNGKKLTFEGYEIYRAANDSSEYKFMFHTTNEWYYNTLIRAGQKYSYKVKGYNTVDGEKVYSDFSTVTETTVK